MRLRAWAFHKLTLLWSQCLRLFFSFVAWNAQTPLASNFKTFWTFHQIFFLELQFMSLTYQVTPYFQEKWQCFFWFWVKRWLWPQSQHPLRKDHSFWEVCISQDIHPFPGTFCRSQAAFCFPRTFIHTHNQAIDLNWLNQLFE